MQNTVTTVNIPPDAFSRFLRSVGDACATLAREVEAARPSPGEDAESLSLNALGLGSLQQAVADVLGTTDESGISPREITDALGRADEPNVRTALESLRKKGVAELLPVWRPQRWRLAEAYR